jgi:hypothetical protein
MCLLIKYQIQNMTNGKEIVVNKTLDASAAEVSSRYKICYCSGKFTNLGQESLTEGEGSVQLTSLYYPV